MSNTGGLRPSEVDGGFGFKTNSADVAIDLRCTWTKTATYKQVSGSLADAYADALRRAEAKFAHE